MKAILTSIILVCLTGSSYATELTSPPPHGTAAPVIAQDDRIVIMLKKSGKIRQDATKEEIQQAVRKYLDKRAKLNQNRKSKPPKKTK